MVFAASAPALALPTAVPADAPPLLVPAKHRWHYHYRHWRYGYQGWSGYPPYYAVPPEMQAQGIETPPAAYPPPAIGSGSSAPAAPLQTSPDPGATRTPATRPKIEWVNPDRPAR